jgi:hypothetical protein
MRDFSRTTLKALANHGITVLRAQAAPAYEGDETFSGRVYEICQDGCSKMRSHAQVMELAR